MRKVLIVILAFVIFLSFAEKSLAVDVEPRAFDVESGFSIGTMRFDGGRPENSGRKFSTEFLFDLIWRGRLEKTLGFRFKTIGEPTDCTFEMLNDTITFLGKVQYELNPDDKIIFSPFLGVELQEWKRNSSTKEKELWGDLLFSQAVFGLGLEYDDLYFELGGLLPFWTNVDEGPAPPGELGFMANFGLMRKERLKIDLFYRQEKFGGDPDSKLKWYGVSAVYRF